MEQPTKARKTTRGEAGRPASGEDRETGPTRATYQPTLHAYVGSLVTGRAAFCGPSFPTLRQARIRGVVTQQTIWLSGNCYYPPHRPPKVLSVLSYEFE